MPSYSLVRGVSSYKKFESMRVEFAGSRGMLSDTYVFGHVKIEECSNFEISVAKFEIKSEDEDVKLIDLIGIKDFERKIQHHYKYENRNDIKFTIEE